MPPRLRRPAAAVDRGVRRPAAAPGERREKAWLLAKDAKLEEFTSGVAIEVQGEYWEGQAEVSGYVVGALVDGSQRYLKLRSTGTRSEELLKHLSGSRSRELQLHLCGDPCEARTWREI